MSKETTTRFGRRFGRARGVCATGLALTIGAFGLAAPVTMALADEQPPDMPSAGSGSGEQGGEAPDGGGSGGGTGGSGANTQTYDYDGSYDATLVVDGATAAEASDGETIESSSADTNVVLVENGGTLDLTDATLTKSGDSSDEDACNFYGINSILLAVGEDSLARVTSCLFSATSEGSNGIFATDGATVWANDVTIETTSDNSRGLDATYGGLIIANDMTISTEGNHSAGAANDRGGGSVSVSNSVIETQGSGSPILYSTGTVEADNVTGTASGSQIAGMEGLNTIKIANSTLTSEITSATASDPVANGVIIYQSTSGDADTSTGERALFEVRDSTLSSAIESGSMFYLTNTSADILLVRTELDFDTDAADLITVEGNDANNWGTAGSNGADVTLTAREQELEGAVSVDTISSLDLYLLDGSTFTGYTAIIENSVASTSDAPISVVIESGSSWVVTADSTVSNLSVEDGASVVDESGETVTIVADGATVVEGTSDITVTVEGSYSTEIDTSGATELTDGTIDRSGFDEYFGTETTFAAASVEEASSDDASSDAASEDAAEAEAAEDAAETEEDSGSGWFASLWASIVSWWSSLFA